jgi:hypothetical protein
MENSHIVEWDLRGWMGAHEPTPNAQRDWNKTLISSINLISSKIHQSSLRGGADTIILHPDLEIILHPDVYDDHTKKLMGMDVILDPTMEKDRIEINNRKALEDLRLIPVIRENDEAMIEFKPITSFSEEEVIKYIEGLVGFVIIENI